MGTKKWSILRKEVKCRQFTAKVARTAFKSPPTKMLHFEQIHLFSKLLLWSCHTCFLNQNLMWILKFFVKNPKYPSKIGLAIFCVFSYISYVISCFPSKNHIFYNRNLIFSMLS